MEAAIREAQEKARSQLLAEIDELRQDAAAEICRQKQSYESEIASLNRALEERHSNDESLPHSVDTGAKEAAWEEIEEILQDTQQRLNLPAKESSVIYALFKF